MGGGGEGEDWSAKYYITVNLSITTMYLRDQSDGGLCRQVVLIQRCISITEVARGAA